MIDLNVLPAKVVRFQGIASLAPEKILSEAADVAGIANTAREMIPRFGNRYLNECIVLIGIPPT